MGIWTIGSFFGNGRKFYRGAVVEADRCGKIKSETFDKLERYGVLESENLRMEGQLEKNEVDLEGFDKQLYE